MQRLVRLPLDGPALIVAALLFALAAFVLLGAAFGQTKDPGGCDIPRAWGRLVQVFPEGRSFTLALEAEDGTVRFLTWARCDLLAVGQRVAGGESKRR